MKLEFFFLWVNFTRGPQAFVSGALMFVAQVSTHNPT